MLRASEKRGYVEIAAEDKAQVAEAARSLAKKLKAALTKELPRAVVALLDKEE